MLRVRWNKRWVLRFQSHKWQFPLVHLENIFVVPRAAAEYIDHAQNVFILFPDTGTTVKLKRCSFVTETIDYQVHATYPWRLDTATPTTDATKGLRATRNAPKFKSFLGLCTV